MPASTPAVTALAASANIAAKEMGGRYDLKEHCVSPAGRSRPPIGLSSAIGAVGIQQSLDLFGCRPLCVRSRPSDPHRIERQRHLQPQSGFVERREHHPSTQAHVLDQDPVSAAETIDRDYPAPR
jgi:hypothetical protein